MLSSKKKSTKIGSEVFFKLGQEREGRCIPRVCKIEIKLKSDLGSYKVTLIQITQSHTAVALETWPCDV